jgi:hypothetical protein
VQLPQLAGLSPGQVGEVGWSPGQVAHPGLVVTARLLQQPLNSPMSLVA